MLKAHQRLSATQKSINRRVALDMIIEAYADAGRQQPAEYPALQAWRDLPLEMREAFIHVFSAGRRSALDEAK